MNAIERTILEAAKRVRVKRRAEAAAMRDAEAKAIAEAVRGKVSLPEHYWQARQVAEEKARAATRIVEALRL